MGRKPKTKRTGIPYERILVSEDFSKYLQTQRIQSGCSSIIKFTDDLVKENRIKIEPVKEERSGIHRRLFTKL